MDSSQPSQFPCTPPPAGGSGGPHQNRADLGDMCAELTEISDNAGSLTIDCCANAPAGEPHFLSPLLQTFNVPADDLCLYHCAEAMKDLWRPTTHTVGMIVWGLLEVYVLMEPDIAKDSSMQITMLCLALEFAIEALAKKGLRLAFHLIIQADNSCRETKTTLS